VRNFIQPIVNKSCQTGWFSYVDGSGRTHQEIKGVGSCDLCFSRCVKSNARFSGDGLFVTACR
jgi:hypothetical protein